MSTHGIDAASGAIPEVDVPRAGVLGAIQGAVDSLNDLMAVLSAIAIATAGAVLTWEVAGRYFFSIPSDWQDELSTFLLIGRRSPPPAGSRRGAAMSRSTRWRPCCPRPRTGPAARSRTC